jgi:hypothetical protein
LAEQVNDDQWQSQSLLRERRRRHNDRAQPLKDDEPMTRDSGYYMLAGASLAIMLGWLSFLMLAAQAAGP